MGGDKAHWRSFPFGQASLWALGAIALFAGLASDYGTNWGAIVVGAILWAAAIALAFLRVLKQPEKARAVVVEPDYAAADTYKNVEVPQRLDSKVESNQPAKGNSGTSAAGKVFGLIVAVIAFVVARVAMDAVFKQVNQSAHSQASEDALLDQARAMVNSNQNFGPMYRRLQSQFPSDYAALLRGMVQLAETNPNDAVAFDYGRSFMRQFYARHRENIAASDSHTLARLMDAQTAVVQQSASVSPALCAQLVETGNPTYQHSRSNMAELTDELLSVNLLTMDAIRSGQTNAQIHEPLTDEDWVRIVDRAVARGANAQTFVAASQGDVSRYSETERCASGRVLYEAISSLPDEELKARFAIAVAAPAAQ